MKNLHHVFASLLMLIALNVNAQNQRALMFECFTNTGCAPCASQNPALDALIDANGDRVTAIKYHMSWPGNNDPMYLHNTQDNDSRKSYYSVNAVPHTVVDGIRFANVPSGLNQNMVNQWLAIESPFEMRMTHQLNATQDTITVIVMAKASSDVSGSLKLMVGVIEKEIHYTSAPGSNGERDFYSVMKKLLPSASGTNLGNMAAGDYVSYKFQWALANVYDLNQLSAVAWIQDGTSKEVFQSCKSSDNFEPFYHNDAAMSNISNVKTMICSGVAEPKAVITNFGSNAISNAEIEVLVNDETVKTLSWEGNLPSFASATVIDDAFIEIYDNGKVTQTINHANYYSTESNLTQQTAPKPEQHTTKLATPEDKTAVHLYSMKSLPQYFGCLKGPYIKDVLLKANMPTDISTIISIPQLERLIELIQLKERERGDHNSYSRAVKMYIEYLQNGLGFKDFEYDSECMRRHNHLCKNK